MDWRKVLEKMVGRKLCVISCLCTSVLVAAMCSGCQSVQDKTPVEEQQSQRVDQGVVVRTGSLSPTVSASSSVLLGRDFAVLSTGVGAFKSVVKVGDKVKAGQVIGFFQGTDVKSPVDAVVTAVNIDSDKLPKNYPLFNLKYQGFSLGVDASQLTANLGVDDQITGKFQIGGGVGPSDCFAIVASAVADTPGGEGDKHPTSPPSDPNTPGSSDPLTATASPATVASSPSPSAVTSAGMFAHSVQQVSWKSAGTAQTSESFQQSEENGASSDRTTRSGKEESSGDSSKDENNSQSQHIRQDQPSHTDTQTEMDSRRPVGKHERDGQAQMPPSEASDGDTHQASEPGKQPPSAQTSTPLASGSMLQCLIGVGDPVRAGQSGIVVLKSHRLDKQLIVPVTSVAGRVGKGVVQRISGGHVEKVDVTLGASDGANIVITSGLKAGDRISTMAPNLDPRQKAIQ